MTQRRTAGAPVSMSAEKRSAVAGGGGDGHSLRRKKSMVTAIVFVVAVLFGLAVSAQVGQTRKTGLEGLRHDQLVVVLSNINESNQRLQREVDTLQGNLDRLRGGDEGTVVREAREQLQRLQILSGTAPVRGPGVQIEVRDGQGTITADVLLGVVQELRDAGAEAIAVGPYRVVASTWFGMKEGRIMVSGQPLPLNYEITAIGERKTLVTALRIPGGAEASLRSKGADVVLTEHADIRLPAVRSDTDSK